MKTVFMRSGVCSFCGQSFKLTGMAMHQKACRRNKTSDMRKLHEELQRHIHGDLCSEVNEMIIHIKLHHTIINGDDDQVRKVLEARGKYHQPKWEDIIELLTKVRDEMNECKQPYRRY